VQRDVNWVNISFRARAGGWTISMAHICWIVVLVSDILEITNFVYNMRCLFYGSLYF